MTTRARLAQDRSRERREALLQAAIELFAEGGTRAVTHRAVARRAGLPSASTTYYFASIEDLVHDALAAHLERWAAELRAMTAGELLFTADPSEGPGLVDAVLSDRPSEVAALHLAVIVTAARDPELTGVVTSMFEVLEDIAETFLRNIGVCDPRQPARIAISMVAGHAMYRLSGRLTPAEEASLLYDGLRALVIAHLPGPVGADAGASGRSAGSR